MIFKRKKKIYRVIVFTLAFAMMLIALNACNRLPNPVEKKNGYSWIPIQDTAFLVQDKTWLKGYSRNSTDGLVSSLTLHAMAPTIQPWNQQINNTMYPPLGRGAAVQINVRSTYRTDFPEHFSRFPQSRWGGHTLIEEPSEFKEFGLRQFREKPYRFKEGQFKGRIVPSHSVFFEKVEGEKVKYFIQCYDKDDGSQKACHLSFPYGSSLIVEINYLRKYLPSSIEIADKISEKLKEFETDGQFILIAKTRTVNKQ